MTTTGREVLEVRPPVRVDKGTAVTQLLAGAGARAALYVGDDRTDADAWRALRALRDAGALDHAVALAVASAEVPAEVREAADAEVDGPAGGARGPARAGSLSGAGRRQPRAPLGRQLLPTGACCRRPPGGAPARRATSTPKRMKSSASSEWASEPIVMRAPPASAWRAMSASRSRRWGCALTSR